MQPTNSDVDYEKALQNYFHYDEEKVDDAAMRVYVCTYGRFSQYAEIFHRKVVQINEGLTLDDGFYDEGVGSTFIPFETYEEDALLVQEFLHDWNDVTGELETECHAIDSLIQMGRDGDNNHSTMVFDGVTI